MILITLAKQDVDDEIRKETFLSVQEWNTHTEEETKKEIVEAKNISTSDKVSKVA